eukprot:7567565-Karenia_brevis.AAC.1
MATVRDQDTMWQWQNMAVPTGRTLFTTMIIGDLSPAMTLLALCLHQGVGPHKNSMRLGCFMSELMKR